MYYGTQSDIRVKSYCRLNLLRASEFNFDRLDILQVSIRHLRKKVIVVWICWELQHSILCVSMYYAPESDLRVKSYDHLNFSRSSIVQFRASRYIMRLNRTSEWKVMTIWISWERPLFNFERLDMLRAWIGHASEKLWPFEFFGSFRCSISSVSIYYAPKSHPRVKSYHHFKFSRADRKSVV